MDSDHRSDLEKHHLMQFAITAALLTLFGALFVVVLLRIGHIVCVRVKHLFKRRVDDGNMQFNSDEGAANEEGDDEDIDTRGNFASQAETHELDMADGDTDAVEMHRLDRP